MGRRNLTPEVASYLRGKRYEAEKGIRGGDRGNQYTKCNETPTSENRNLAEIKKGDTSTFVAKEYNVARSTIGDDFKYAKAIDKISAMHKDPAKIKGEILSLLGTLGNVPIRGSPTNVTARGTH